MLDFIDIGQVRQKKVIFGPFRVHIYPTMHDENDWFAVLESPIDVLQSIKLSGGRPKKSVIAPIQQRSSLTEILS